MPDIPPGPLEDHAPPRLRERIGAAFRTAGDLLVTRGEIFRQEAAGKAAHLGRGIASFVIAGALAFMTTFLLTALLVALFTLLFGRLWAGILATLILFLAVAAAAAMFGWKALLKVRPFDFPVTGAELRKDWEALQRSTDQGEETADSFAPGGGKPARPAPVDDFEARFRAGSE